MVILVASAAPVEGAIVTATWDPNPEPDIAGYVVYYGTQSGNYTASVDVGNVSSWQVNLSPGVRYHFAVQAYNSSLQVSPLSTEVDIVPIGVNQAPTLTAISNQTTAENTAVSLQLVGSDADGNALTYSATNLPPGVSVNAGSGLISGTPTYTSAGSYAVTATVSDGSLSASRTFTWTITNVNRAPTLVAPGNQTSLENTAVVLQLSGSDPDGTAVTYSAVGLPSGLSVNASTGRIAGTVSGAQQYTVTVTASDGGLSVSRSFTWSVVARDIDSDGMPDGWELQYGFDPNTNDANADPDGDGYTNLQEYQRGSHPTRTAVWPQLMDVDGDRGGDAFLYNRVSGQWQLTLSNRITDAFTSGLSSWDPGWQVYPARLTDDGYTDFFLYDPARGLWVQALNDQGTGVFRYTLGNWDRSWTVVPADLDGDRLTDLFVYNVATGVWVKCFVDGAGDFKGYNVGQWDPGWTLTVGDFNADERDDLFVYNPTTGVWVETWSQAGLGAFDYVASGVWDPGWQIVPADLNGDQHTDLFVLNAAGVHVSVLSRPGGNFDYVGDAPWWSGWGVTPGDLNNDGRTDLFLYNPSTGTWVQAFSDGAGRFTYASGQWDPGWTVAATDFNEDGFGDLLLGRGDGTWVKAITMGPGEFRYTVGNWGTGWTMFAHRSVD